MVRSGDGLASVRMCFSSEMIWFAKFVTMAPRVSKKWVRRVKRTRRDGDVVAQSIQDSKIGRKVVSLSL